MRLTPGAIVGGKYRLDRPVSRGGMGAVWAAQHLHLGSPVAVKFMDPSYAESPAFRARFEREARVAASLQSPNVVSVQDYGIDAAGPYIVMELLHGEDLQTRLERRRRLTLLEMARIVTQIGRALRRAHEAGLIHRDLKPRNIYLARDDDDEVVKVLDFGIAKHTVGHVIGESTKTGEIMGSPHYMSPEQLRADKDLDPRADLWSVGVMAFRGLTGRLPFPGDVLGTVMAKVLVDPIPLASQLAPDLPREVDAFFERALARDRDQRFQTVRALVEAFNRVAGVAPLGATVTGPHASPYAIPESEPRGSLASLPFDLPLPAPLPPPTPPPAVVTPASTALPPVSTLPPAFSPNTPVGTLTTANVAGMPDAHLRRVRAVWIAGAVTFVLVAVIGSITVLRLTGKEQAADAADAPSETAGAVEGPPTAEPAAAEPSVTPAADPLPAPDPSASASASASAAAPASAAAAATAAPKATATAQPQTGGGAKSPGASTQRRAPPPAPPPPAPPTATATTRPRWGF
jgi:serine/threonine-protein kinase